MLPKTFKNRPKRSVRPDSLIKEWPKIWPKTFLTQSRQGPPLHFLEEILGENFYLFSSQIFPQKFIISQQFWLGKYFYYIKIKISGHLSKWLCSWATFTHKSCPNGEILPNLITLKRRPTCQNMLLRTWIGMDQV